MTSSALPGNWQELLAGYVLGDLDPDEIEAVSQWLEAYPDLHEEVYQLQETLGLIPGALTGINPPDQLRTTIVQSARMTAQTDQRHQTGSVESAIAARVTPQRFQRLWIWQLGGAIAAIALVAVAIDNYRLRQDLRQSQTVVTLLQQPDTRVYVLSGTAQEPAASGTVILNPSQQDILIVTDNLPPLPAGQTYRLWAIAANAASPAYCGDFNVSTDAGLSQWTLPAVSCSSAIAQLLVTAESADDPPIPKGPLILQSSG